MLCLSALWPPPPSQSVPLPDHTTAQDHRFFYVANELWLPTALGSPLSWSVDRMSIRLLTNWEVKEATDSIYQAKVWRLSPLPLPQWRHSHFLQSGIQQGPQEK